MVPPVLPPQEGESAQEEWKSDRLKLLSPSHFAHNFSQVVSRQDQSQEAREMQYLSSLFVSLPTSLYSCTCLCVWRACVLCSFVVPGRPSRQDQSKDGQDIAFFQFVIVTCIARLVVYQHLLSACELVLGGRPTVACISSPALLRMCWCDCILSSR